MRFGEELFHNKRGKCTESVGGGRGDGRGKEGPQVGLNQAGDQLNVIWTVTVSQLMAGVSAD